MIQLYIDDISVQEDSYYGSITEPVTLSEAKKQLIVTFDDDDDYITMLIGMCRQAVEDYTHVSIIEKTVTLTLHAKNTVRLAFSSAVNYERAELELPYGPVPGNVDVTRVNPGEIGGIHIDALDCFEIIGTNFKRIAVDPGMYLVIYKAGYGSGVPRILKMAILNEIAYRYEKRGNEGKRYNSDQPGICAAAQAIADKHVRTWL